MLRFRCLLPLMAPVLAVIGWWWYSSRKRKASPSAPAVEKGSDAAVVGEVPNGAVASGTEEKHAQGDAAEDSGGSLAGETLWRADRRGLTIDPAAGGSESSGQGTPCDHDAPHLPNAGDDEEEEEEEEPESLCDVERVAGDASERGAGEELPAEWGAVPEKDGMMSSPAAPPPPPPRSPRAVIGCLPADLPGAPAQPDPETVGEAERERLCDPPVPAEPTFRSPGDLHHEGFAAPPRHVPPAPAPPSSDTEAESPSLQDRCGGASSQTGPVSDPTQEESGGPPRAPSGLNRELVSVATEERAVGPRDVGEEEGEDARPALRGDGSPSSGEPRCPAVDRVERRTGPVSVKVPRVSEGDRVERGTIPVSVKAPRVSEGDRVERRTSPVSVKEPRVSGGDRVDEVTEQTSNELRHLVPDGPLWTSVELGRDEEVISAFLAPTNREEEEEEEEKVVEEDRNRGVESRQESIRPEDSTPPSPGAPLADDVTGGEGSGCSSSVGQSEDPGARGGEISRGVEVDGEPSSDGSGGCGVVTETETQAQTCAASERARREADLASDGMRLLPLRAGAVAAGAGGGRVSPNGCPNAPVLEEGVDDAAGRVRTEGRDASPGPTASPSSQGEPLTDDVTGIEDSGSGPRQSRGGARGQDDVPAGERSPAAVPVVPFGSDGQGRGRPERDSEPSLEGSRREGAPCWGERVADADLRNGSHAVSGKAGDRSAELSSQALLEDTADRKCEAPDLHTQREGAQISSRIQGGFSPLPPVASGNGASRDGPAPDDDTGGSTQNVRKSSSPETAPFSPDEPRTSEDVAGGGEDGESGRGHDPSSVRSRAVVTSHREQEVELEEEAELTLAPVTSHTEQEVELEEEAELTLAPVTSHTEQEVELEEEAELMLAPVTSHTEQEEELTAAPVTSHTEQEEEELTPAPVTSHTEKGEELTPTLVTSHTEKGEELTPAPVTSHTEQEVELEEEAELTLAPVTSHTEQEGEELTPTPVTSHTEQQEEEEELIPALVTSHIEQEAELTPAPVTSLTVKGEELTPAPVTSHTEQEKGEELTPAPVTSHTEKREALTPAPVTSHTEQEEAELTPAPVTSHVWQETLRVQERCSVPSAGQDHRGPLSRGERLVQNGSAQATGPEEVLPAAAGCAVIGRVSHREDGGRSDRPARAPSPDLSVWEVEVPKLLVGRLIGKRGRYVSFLKQRSGAKIRFSPRLLSQESQICRIEGTKQQVHRALDLIGKKFEELDLTNVYTPPPPLPLPPPPPPPPPPPKLPSLPAESWLLLPDEAPVEVAVVKVVSGSRMFVQQPKHPSYPALRALDRDMRLCYSQPAPGLPSPTKVGVVCAAPGPDGAWWRAQVTSLHSETGEAEIRYVDHGGYHRAKMDTLHQIRSDFVKLPFQGAEVILNNVKPLPGGGSDWAEARAALEEMTGGGGASLLAQVTGYSGGGVPFVQMWKKEEEEEELVSVNRALVDRGLAAWLETSCISNQ